MAVVVPKRVGDQGYDCVDLLVNEFHKIGLIVDTVPGLNDEFLKLAAPVEVLGKAAAELRLKKRTQIGVDLQFEWDEADAFVKQSDGSLFSWCERFRCYNHMIYGIVNKSDSAIVLKSDSRDIRWEPGKPLLWKLENEAIVKEVFPIHDEIKRKRLLKCWALNWRDLIHQPLDEIYAYYGAKIAIYFAFIGMYTKWLLFPAAFGIFVQLIFAVLDTSLFLCMHNVMGSLLSSILEAEKLYPFGQVLENLMENSLPYIKYSYRKYRAVRNKRKREKGMAARKSYFNSRVEKEYFKPIYSASVGEELEDGLFDEFLELALQFGTIMMFACAFPPAFAFAALNNVTEIRADALKILVMYRRPVPRVAATVGAWLNIFQFLIVVSICTNCILLVCLYDKEGNWSISPGLAAILIMEHVLLLIKFGFSRIVPEEPDWVKANRMKNATQAQNMCSKQLLRNISGRRGTLVTGTPNAD
ncbi:hypothetical protein M8C21_000525 [Ambrosia artemisiifolia]|uniref:Anoctamin transmembrane domain-containing protein n=1 Tax=Ambrosia artemisiifolia TaxID=4212 RepID=A0AAD5GD41_AMBAR|nr:hypothetical protein M8C21_000525 [Ambrosia artemisiifolia]